MCSEVTSQRERFLCTRTYACSPGFASPVHHRLPMPYFWVAERLLDLMLRGTLLALIALWMFQVFEDTLSSDFRASTCCKTLSHIWAHIILIFHIWKRMLREVRLNNFPGSASLVRKRQGYGLILRGQAFWFYTALSTLLLMIWRVFESPLTFGASFRVRPIAGALSVFAEWI